MRPVPLACVMGDMDLVRPLGLAGIPCAVVARAGAPPRFSRFSRAVVPWADPWEQPDALVDSLVRFAAAQPERPVLFYEEDGHLLLISRHRARLAQVFRFVIADPFLVEDLVDKARFQALASRVGLPVPPSRCVTEVQTTDPRELDLAFPVIMKPLTRRPITWAPVAGDQKAVQVDSLRDLIERWPRVVDADVPVLLQQLIPGTEAAIESYHVYVDDAGSVAAEFTGKKIRTYPERYGDSTALVITDAPDVRELGREIVGRLRLRGVAKFDFKRAPDGRLYLLEINPRFTLWHHPAAVAGLNIPAIVYRDLTGIGRTRAGTARAGVTWCRVWKDVRAAREMRMPLGAWMSWTMACEAKSTLAWDDPLPLLGAAMWRGLARLPWMHAAARD